MSKLKDLTNSEVFKGKMVFKKYKFYELGEVKLLYPNKKDIEKIIHIMARDAKINEEGNEFDIDLDVVKIAIELLPDLTNLDLSDISEDDIRELLNKNHPEFNKLIDDMFIIIESMSDIFIKAIHSKS